MSPSKDETSMRVLVIGAGGRDHALCRAFSRSPLCRELHAAPGNAGIAQIATCHFVELSDLASMVELAVRIQPDLVVIGAEDLLVAGLASMMEDAGIVCFGPSRLAAQLEGSKVFAKRLMEQAGVPTPRWRSCSDVASAHAAIDELGGAVAVKADGLAAGCGAFVCPNPSSARKAVQELMVKRIFGDAGDHIIVEQLVDGDEVSIMVLSDGERISLLPAACDYKRLLDDAEGPNTGGMGAHAPSTELEHTQIARLAEEYVLPIVHELARRQTPFRGVIYAGVMLTAQGPQVLEYNCRFGNPETQALVRIMGDRDLLELVYRAAIGSFDDSDCAHPGVDENCGVAVAVCVAAEHYPDLQLEPQPVRVTGLKRAAEVEGVELYHGMTQAAELGENFDDVVYAAGGRVVTVSAWGQDYELAISRAYEAVDMIRFPGARARRDIGRAAVVRRPIGIGT